MKLSQKQKGYSKSAAKAEKIFRQLRKKMDFG